MSIVKPRRVAGVEVLRAPRSRSVWGLTSFDPSHPILRLLGCQTLFAGKIRFNEGVVIVDYESGMYWDLTQRGKGRKEKNVESTRTAEWRSLFPITKSVFNMPTGSDYFVVWLKFLFPLPS
jgi:hypothetical protein